MTGLLASVFSFETLFVLYLFAGRFKADALFSWVPVDLTLLFMALSSGAAVYVVLRQARIDKRALLGVLFYLMFAGWATASLVWAPQAAYAADKAFRMLTLGFWAYAGAALVISGGYVRMRRFCVVLVLISVWVAVETLLAYSSGGALDPQLHQVLGGSYLGVGRTVGLGLTVLVVDWLFTRGRSWVQTALLLLGIGLLSLSLLAAGGRGPFLATVFSVSLAIGITRRISKATVLGLAVAAAITLAAGFVPQVTLYRLSVLVEDPLGGTSAYERLTRMEEALWQFQESPVIGRGIGGFYYYCGDPPLERDYPHNIFLEVLAELGLVGLALLCLLSLVSLRRIQWRALRRDPFQLLAVLFVVNTLLNALVSGDLPDNRLLFTALGLSVAASGKRHERPE